MHMGDDSTGGESPHGVAKNVTGNALDNVLHELSAKCFQPLPFLRATDAHVGHGLITEPVFTYAGLYVGQPPSGWKPNE